MSVHAIRRHYASAWVWIFGHLPFIMGYTLSATAMSKIVLAHDVSHSDEGSLEKPYDEESPEYVATGLRWFYCGGLCVALIFSCIISLSHLYHVKEDARLTQSSRLIYRSGAAISILMLPLAPKERLESLALVGITCSIVISCLIVDLYGLSSKDKEYVPLYLERPQEIARHGLYKILKRGLHPSTKCDTIIIDYGPETEENEYRHHIKAVAWAIKKTSSRQEVNSFKAQIQNITVPSCRGLIKFGRSFLHQVHSIEVKVTSCYSD